MIKPDQEKTYAVIDTVIYFLIIPAFCTYNLIVADSWGGWTTALILSLFLASERRQRRLDKGGKQIQAYA